LDKSQKIKWLKRATIVLLVIGTLDPMEGSILIAIASVLAAIRAGLDSDQQYSFFLYTASVCVTGVFFLFFFSSFGGFGGEAGISWWWGLLVLPYPVAWLSLIILLIRSAIRSRKSS
jgi:hypothetical protein